MLRQSIRFFAISVFVLIGFVFSGCPLEPRIKGSSKKDQVSLEKERVLIRKSISEGKHYHAIKRYRKLSSENPESPYYYYLYGYVLKKEQSKWKAFDQCLRRDSKFYWCLVGRGRVYVEMNVWDRALADFKTAKSIRPSSVEPKVGMARMAFKRKEDKRALQLYQEVLSKKPGHRDATHDIALIYYRSSQDEKAISWYKKLLEKEPSNFGALRIVGELHQKQKQLGQATPFFERALKVRKKDFRLHMQLAGIYEKMGQPNRALALYENASKLPKAHFHSYYRLGALRSMNGDYKGALKAFNQARRLNGKHGGLLYEIGKLYLRQNDPERAASALWKALKIEPQKTIIRVSLASALLKKKEYADVLKQYQEILKREPKNQKIKKDRSKLLNQLGLSDKMITARSNQAVLAKAKGVVIRCYRNRLKDKPKLKGKIEVVLAVYPKRVENVSINDENTTIKDPIIRTCVKWTFMHALFPAIRKPVRVRYSFTLRR